jgi:hypothetical protein
MISRPSRSRAPLCLERFSWIAEFGLARLRETSGRRACRTKIGSARTARASLLRNAAKP